jgi:hypothetical protein
MGIPTSNILQPGAISLASGVNRALISDLQLLTPQYYNKYVEKYGNEEFFQWLATYAGMEEVKNREYFWFENRGKLMIGVQIAAVVSGTPNVNGAQAQVRLAVGDHYGAAGDQTPLRVGETIRIASTNVEAEIISIPVTTPFAFQFVIKPKLSTQKLASSGSATIETNDVMLFGGDMDAGEASDSIDPLIHLDVKQTNTITEMRESWKATDLAEMTEVYYSSGVSGADMAGGAQAGSSYFTYKGLVKSNRRFLNNIEAKLMKGNRQDQQLIGTNTVGTQGFIPKVQADGETVTYGGTIDISKMHEITRIMDVNGCAKDNVWLMDIYQRQQFSDGIFSQYPAGAYVWGRNETSEEAAVNYGVQTLMIDGYVFKVKKYKSFNSEVTVGLTPNIDYFRNFGVICPQGVTRDASTSDGANIKNITVMYQQPPKGGTIGNGIRVWQHGGGSLNPTSGKMVDQVEMICYRGLRVAAANQFVILAGT